MPAPRCRRTTGQHIAEVRAFLLKYYGGDGKPDQQQDLFAPLHTVTSKARFGLVTIARRAVRDRRHRHADARSLTSSSRRRGSRRLRDRPDFNGKPMTKTAQIALAGNSVCCQVAEALVRANIGGAAEARAA
jgi:DNA (cytosine-5)-methyltransferase 1